MGPGEPGEDRRRSGTGRPPPVTRVEIVKSPKDGAYRWCLFGGKDRGWHMSEPWSTYGTCLDAAATWAEEQGYELALPEGWWVYRREHVVF